MEIGAVEHIRTKASLVVQVIDDFTNRVISDGSVQVFIEGASKPIHKSEGYYIFLNLGMAQARLTVTSFRYGIENRIINLSTLNESEPMVKIRLKPNRNYSLPEGTTSVFGMAEPESEIRVVCDSVQKFYRLLYDYDREKLKDEINIFNPDKTDLDGKVLMIRDKDDSVSETFYIIGTKDRESGVYQIGSVLENNYKKVGTKIFQVFVTRADDKGEFFMPLYNLGENPVNCQCEMLGRQKVNRDITLETGRMNKLKFED